VLLLAGIGVAGMCLGLLAGLVLRHALPRFAGAPSAGVNITTAAVNLGVSVMIGWRFGSSPELAAYLLLAVAGVQLARIDFVHHVLPNRLVAPLLGAGLALLGIAAGTHGAAEDLLRGVAGGATLFLLYLILALTSRNGLGMGDVKLAAPLGLYLGYLGWSQLFYGGALGFVAGGVTSAVVLLRNRGNKPPEVAYGPSMLVAGLAVILLVR
jgi:leader peptidase (prepilin peptidase)/N-methyltransferase